VAPEVNSQQSIIRKDLEPTEAIEFARSLAGPADAACEPATRVEYPDVVCSRAAYCDRAVGQAVGTIHPVELMSRIASLNTDLSER
jgi:hypothetical protein